MSVLPKAEKPAHVPDELVVDFDFFRPGPEGSDPFLAWTRLHEYPPVVWTPRNGGHWIVTRGEETKEVLTDLENFSSRSAFIGMANNRPRAVPLEYDPPDHGPLRKTLLPAFAPKSVALWSDEARRLAIELIEGFRPNGRCEFMGDFAQQLPMIIFLKMVDLPLEDRAKLVSWVNTGLRSTDQQARVDARDNLNRYMSALVKERQAKPGDDMLSQALHADIGGRKMNWDEALGVASGLLGGGLDTVASSMGWMALFLAQNPAHRRQLIEDDKLIVRSIDEFLRRFSIPNIARVVKHDMEYKGAPLKAGEQILMSGCIHGLDARSFENPMEVDFNRRDAFRHSTFSHGIHRCVGQALALQEMRIFLQEWLPRIPDFALDPKDKPVMVTGIVHGLARLPLVWAA